jgi:hypothetical protein
VSEDPVQMVLGEVYRYRLAIKDQQLRIEQAKSALRSVRDDIDKRMEEEIFTFKGSADEFGARLEDLQHKDVPESWRLKTEAQFMLIAIYDLYLMAKRLRDATTDEEQSCLEKAISDFQSAAPRMDLLRHIHEHQDAYLVGEGRRQAELPQPPDSWVVGSLEEGGLAFWFGGRKLFLTEDIAKAADALAESIHLCLPNR